MSVKVDWIDKFPLLFCDHVVCLNSDFLSGFLHVMANFRPL
jgi:hypothetical protein